VTDGKRAWARWRYTLRARPLLGALSWSANLFGVDWPWLKSPIGMGA
jgi:hypothetical protein